MYELFVIIRSDKFIYEHFLALSLRSGSAAIFTLWKLKYDLGVKSGPYSLEFFSHILYNIYQWKVVPLSFLTSCVAALKQV